MENQPLSIARSDYGRTIKITLIVSID